MTDADLARLHHVATFYKYFRSLCCAQHSSLFSVIVNSVVQPEGIFYKKLSDKDAAEPAWPHP